MAYLLGWKDILRPIRDGYRHLFPSPDTGPTPVEREKQRHIDQRKGFTYFDTFDQLEAWTGSDSDPIQRANTPLLARLPVALGQGQQKANVLICHDYSGNYHDYEAVTAVGVDEEAYCCEYLQYVESFVYFSHKLVCVPPPSWTNVLHRNGVKAFGTLLIEPQTKDSERLLKFTQVGKEARADKNFPLAKQLSDIARHYGFDGWLINIEKPFPQEVWEVEDFDAFLRQLKKCMGPSREIIWYDALTSNNKVAYQNGINSKNIAFASTCGAVLTNYCWKEGDAISSKDVALRIGLPLDKVYFGIDVWAQNTTKLGYNPRITYPEVKGGGTNTGIAVNKLTEIGLSAGIFAPAWSFEHFPGHGRLVEHSMWEGGGLWDRTTCSCAREASYCHPDNSHSPITGSAAQFPAGSEKFFYTDFNRAFTGHGEKETQRIYNGKVLHSQLGSQSILPTMSQAWAKDDRLRPVDLAHTGLHSDGSTAYLAINGKLIDPDLSKKHRTYERELPLFKLDMPADGSLQLAIPCAYFLHIPEAVTSIYLKFSNGIKHVPLQDFAGFQKVECTVKPDREPYANMRLRELGVRIRSTAFPKSVDCILKIYEIRIMSRVYLDCERNYSIHGIRIGKRGEGDTEHWRLRWMYLDPRCQNDSSALTISEVQYSDVTGPFSYFVVKIDGVELGRAYALEYILPQSLVEGFRQRNVGVVLIGMGFDGREIARCEREVQAAP